MDGSDAEEARGRERTWAPAAVLPARLCARGRPSRLEWVCLAVAVALTALAARSKPSVVLPLLHAALWIVFMLNTFWRLAAVAISRPVPSPTPLQDAQLPTYSAIVPLKGESNMVGALIQRLDRIDYPRDRLQILLALETFDGPTRAAVAAHRLPPSFEVVLTPDDEAPKGKPRACNAALALARGRFVVIYDAEDEPDPMQLREAAARFAGESPSLACLQAPLRVEPRRRLFTRQFALEYAALFEVMLPAMARIGAPFPLGGTSNHFRVDALRAVGGWDSWNVTEDADLGFRLTAAGYRSGVIGRPTWEDPPLDLGEWLPQRTRWLKGYLQTWLVHACPPFRGGGRHALALQATLGVSLLSSALHGPTIALLIWSVLSPLIGAGPAFLHLEDFALLGSAWAAAGLCLWSGARRARIEVRWSDLAWSVAYWPLLTLAFACAFCELMVAPHRWNKTPHHTPEELEQLAPTLDAPPGGVVSPAE